MNRPTRKPITADDYAASLREPDERGRTRDPYACAVGTIRGLTYQGITDEQFRDEVIAVLDAAERVAAEQLDALRGAISA